MTDYMAMGIVRVLYRDLTRRGGIGLDQVDDEVKTEMLNTWYALVCNELYPSRDAPAEIPDILERM